MQTSRIPPTLALRRSVVSGLLATITVATLIPISAHAAPQGGGDPRGPSVELTDDQLLAVAPPEAFPVAGTSSDGDSLSANCGLPWNWFGRWYQLCVTDNFRYYVRRFYWW